MCRTVLYNVWLKVKIYSIKPAALLMTRHITFNEKQVDTKMLSEIFKVRRLWLKNLVRNHHMEG